MNISSPSPSLSRESDKKQIDQSDSIRSTYLSNEDIRVLGEDVARNAVSALPAFAPFDFFARNRENEKEILRVYRTTATDVEAGETITPAAEWLLDNHYIIEEAIHEVRRDFPRRFYRELPLMKVDGVGIPRTLVLAWLYVAHTHSTVSEESLTALVEGFQQHAMIFWLRNAVLRRSSVSPRAICRRSIGTSSAARSYRLVLAARWSPGPARCSNI